MKSPVFQLFSHQHQQAKALFLELGKEIKSAKAIALLEQLEFLELYSELLEKIHFEQKHLGYSLFFPLKTLKKSLKKIHHLKLVEKGLKEREKNLSLTFESFKTYLNEQKRGMQKEAFDLMVGSSLKMWEDYLEKAFEASKGIKPLVLNTSIHQLVQEELAFMTKEVTPPMSTQGFRDLFEGLRKVIILENLLVHLGLNPIYLPQIHEELERLKNGLKPWYANHLNLQSLTHFIGQQEEVSKKYLDWVKELKDEKKSLTATLEKQAVSLLRKVGN
ncbi:MAG: hypothetical protein LW824_20825 [Algoriphagus sp.]|jgi:hypothetical protein|nr:hypothetical protein [Algoriphagus sp.]MCE2780010.1 hypothetical protein [Algoriphagus sp.]